MTSTELKKNISKIKKLLKQRDYDVIDTGIELIRSLNEREIFETLLDGIKFEIPIDKKSGWKAKHKWPMELIRNKFFTGTAPARPYLDYALWNIIGYAPQKSRIDKSIKLSNIKKVELEGGIKDPKWEKLPTGFLNFKNLTSLKVSGGCVSRWVGMNEEHTNWSGVKSLEGISELTSLTHLYISGHDTDNLDFLNPHTNLLYLRANNCSYLKNIDVVKNCKNLTKLNLESCHSLVNIDGLINCKNLNELSLKSCHSLVNLNGLINCAKLMDNDRHRKMSTGSTWEVDFPCFNLYDCKSLKNLDGLINAKQLTGINIEWCPALENIDGLVNCINISNIQFGNNDIIKNLDSLANKKKIKRLAMMGLIGLEDIKGIASCSNLTHLTINSSKLTNIKQLANCKKLEFLDMGICQDITIILDLKKLKNLRLDIYRIKRVIPPSSKSNFSLMAGNLDAIKRYKKRIALVMALNKNDTKALSKFKNDTSIDLSGCSGLKSVNGLADFSKLTNLNLSNCINIKPKPSPVHMATRAHVASYQIKLMGKEGLKVPDSYSDIARTIKKEIKISTEERTLKPTILKVNKLLRSDNNYKLGIELIKALDNPKITKATEKTVINRIKKFLKQRDYKIIDEGIEFVRELDNYFIYEILLDGCAIKNDGERRPLYRPKQGIFRGELVRGRFFKGTGPAQPWLDYALWNIISCLPDNIKKDKSLMFSNIKNIDLGSLELMSIDDWLWNRKRRNLSGKIVYDKLTYTKFPAGLTRLKHITSINLNGCYSLRSIDDFLHFNSLISIEYKNCRAIKNLDGLKNCTRLTDLNLENCNVSNLDGLLTCINLKYLELQKNRGGIQNLNGLRNCTKLERLSIEYCDKLTNLDGLENCIELLELDASNCESLQNLDGLSNCSKLTSLNLYGCHGIQNIDGLANLSNLTNLSMGGICETDFNGNFIAHLPFGGSKVQPKPKKQNMTTRGEVIAYQKEIKKTIKLRKRNN